MPDLLKGQPGVMYVVEGPLHDPQQEKAKADDNGVLRDEDGRAYSPSAYEIIERTEEKGYD